MECSDVFRKMLWLNQNGTENNIKADSPDTYYTSPDTSKMELFAKIAAEGH